MAITVWLLEVLGISSPLTRDTMEPLAMAATPLWRRKKYAWSPRQSDDQIVPTIDEMSCNQFALSDSNVRIAPTS